MVIFNNIRAKKQGQLTIFIIIAIVVVALAIFIISLISYHRNYDITNSKQIAIIKENIEDCIGSTTVNAIEFISDQGGFYTPPEKSLILGSEFIPYYYYSTPQAPDMDQIKQSISQYIITFLPYCLEMVNYSNFEVNYTNLDKKMLNIHIDDNSIAVNIKNWPVTVTKVTENNKKITIKDFHKEIETDFFSTIKKCIDFSENDIKDGFINVDALADIKLETQANITMLKINDSTAITVKKPEYEIKFAIKP